jgi:site-specific DNA recombinase
MRGVLSIGDAKRLLQRYPLNNGHRGATSASPFRVEVDVEELRIMGSKSELLRTLVAASSAKTAGLGVPSSVPKWRARRDSNSRPSDSKSDALSS